MRTERVHDDLFVVVHAEPNPSDLEWEAYCTAVSHPGLVPVRAIIVVTVGGGPNAAQRRRLLSALASRPASPRVAILSRSALVRGIVGALNLFAQQPMRMYAPRDSAAAFDYLEVHGAERKRMKDTVFRLAAELGLSVDLLEMAA